MKSFKILLALLVLTVAAVAQTKDHGLGAFSNEQGPIMLAVDASVASRDLASPYVLFVVFMGAKDQKENIVVAREGVSLIYNGQEYKMPSPTRSSARTMAPRSGTSPFTGTWERRGSPLPGSGSTSSRTRAISSRP